MKETINYTSTASRQFGMVYFYVDMNTGLQYPHVFRI